MTADVKKTRGKWPLITMGLCSGMSQTRRISGTAISRMQKRPNMNQQQSDMRTSCVGFFSLGSTPFRPAGVTRSSTLSQGFPTPLEGLREGERERETRSELVPSEVWFWVCLFSSREVEREREAQSEFPRDLVLRFVYLFLRVQWHSLC